MPLLSIIITYHNEGFKVIQPLIESISKQENVNWEDVEIIISNNCEQPIDLYLRDYYLPTVKFIYPDYKNSLAASRECGMQNSQGEYIMFCDADDTLSDPWALMHVFQILTQQPNYDMYNFIELITYKPDLMRGYYDPLPEDTQQWRNLVFCHGKVYRKQFIIDNDLHFKTTLRTHEDVNFNLVFNGLGGREYNSDWWLYNWIQWPQSISHQKTKEYRIQTLMDDIYCWILSYQEILDKKGTLDYVKHDLLTNVSFAYKTIKIEGKYYQAEEQLEEQLVEYINEFNLYPQCLEQEVKTIGVENYKHFIERILYQHSKKNFSKAWVTLLSDNTYMPGETALIMSLKETYTMYPIFCVVTPEVTEENLNILMALGVRTIPMEKIIPDGYDEYSEKDWYNATSLGQAGWHNALTKLNIYNLTQFDTIVYIDNDTRVFENMDDLFNKPHMSAVMDVHGNGPSFCSGLLVLHPNHEEFEKLMNFFLNFKTDGMIHDQLVLQNFFTDWPEREELHLPIIYHTWTTKFTGEETSILATQGVKALHYIDAKPWRTGRQYFINMQDQYPVYVQLTLEYVEYINKCIVQLNQKSLYSENLLLIK